ncbi:MAG: hypothetical protein IJY90_03720, partial [Clostridia bacterium]|nr:hypothetical protein [Clostridia bacterium]
MYRFRKFLKGLAYTFVYIFISIASAYGVINLSMAYVKGDTQISAENSIPVQITTMIDNFAAANAIDIDLSAEIDSGNDNFDISLDAQLDLSNGFENLSAQGNIAVVIGSNMDGAAATLNQSAQNDAQTISVNFSYQNGFIYIDALGGKIMVETNNLMDSITQILSLANINLDDLGVGEILNMPLNDLLGMFSNIKEETIDEETGRITLVISLPLVGDASLIFDHQYNLLGIYSDMAISEGLNVTINGGLDYPEEIVIEEKNQEEYINALNMLEVVEPLMNYINNTQFALDLTVTQTGTESAQTLANGKLYLDIQSRRAKFTINAFDEQLDLHFADNTIYIEFRNIFAKFNLNYIDKVQAFLKSHFDITLPQDVLDMVLAVLNGEEVALPTDMNLDLSSIDLSFIESVDVEDNVTIITLEDVGAISIAAEDGNLSYIAFNGFGFEAKADIIEYSDVALTQDENAYINLASIIPTIDNALNIINCQLIQGNASIEVDGNEFEINFAYDQVQKLATAYTTIFDLKLALTYANNNIYINFADKFKFVCNCSTVASDFTAFIDNLGIEMPQVDTEELIDAIMQVVDPSVNPRLLTGFEETENGLEITILDNITITLENGQKTIALETSISNVNVDIAVAGVDSALEIEEINHEEYTDINVVLNLISKVYNTGITNLITPALNTLASQEFGLTIDADFDGNTLPIQANISLKTKELSLSTNVMGLDLNVFYQNETIYLEAGNIYLTFALTDFDKVESFLADNVGITLPHEIVDAMLKLLTEGKVEVDIKDVINKINIDLSSIDLSIFDNINVADGKATISIDENTITIDYNETQLTGFAFDGAINISADITEYQAAELTTNPANYIDVTAFIPTVENVLAIANAEKLYGKLVVNIEDVQVELTASYDKANNTAYAHTNVMGLDINIYLTNGKVFVNVADKFKLVADTTTFIDDITAFLADMDISLDMPETAEIISTILEVLSPENNARLIKSFRQTSSGLIITLFNDITFAITNGSNEIALNSAFDNGSIFAVVKVSKQDVVIPEIVEDEFINVNTILDIVSTAYGKGLFNLITPALNTISTGNIGLNVNVVLGDVTLPASVNLSLNDKSLAVSTSINNTALNLFYQDEVFFVEYGNLYFQVKLTSYNEIEAFLADNFGITLPSDIIAKAIDMITAESMTIEEMISSIDFDITSLVNGFDLTFFDNITVTEDMVTINLDGNVIELDYTAEKLVGVKFNDITATFVDFENTTLTTDKANYIDLTDFFPTIQNVLDIVESDVIAGSINATINDTTYTVTFEYDQVNNTAYAHTNVMDLDINIYLTNGKVFVNVADKFKLVADTATFVDDITAFLANMDINTNIDTDAILAEVANVLNPAVNALLVKSFVATDTTIALTLFN